MKTTATCAQTDIAAAAFSTLALRPADATPAAKGPQPLDPGLLHLVAGGAPRGGWQAVELETTTTQAPRGGW